MFWGIKNIPKYNDITSIINKCSCACSNTQSSFFTFVDCRQIYGSSAEFLGIPKKVLFSNVWRLMPDQWFLSRNFKGYQRNFFFHMFIDCCQINGSSAEFLGISKIAYLLEFQFKDNYHFGINKAKYRRKICGGRDWRCRNSFWVRPSQNELYIYSYL